MLDWIPPLGPWHWLVLGIVLIILEVLAPAAFFMWLAMAAGVVAVLLTAFPAMTWQLQLVLYAVVSVLSVILGRRFLTRHPIKSDEPTLNRRGHQYVGRVFTLEQPVVNGVGKIRVDDTTWKICGADCAVGTKVRVTGVDGVVLVVSPVEDSRPTA
ncbi:MAG: NfeD family protein [Chromatiaceae bacterium]